MIHCVSYDVRAAFISQLVLCHTCFTENILGKNDGRLMSPYMSDLGLN